ncbi:hypothetical protein OI71_22295 [Aeromonas hydrophila]|nr:hypothetical protein OI71_22295 [Aeromonas hydrophila]
MLFFPSRRWSSRSCLMAAANNILTGGDRRERPFLELLTPFEKLVDVDVVQASDMRDDQSGLKGLLHDGDLFLRSPASTALSPC